MGCGASVASAHLDKGGFNTLIDSKLKEVNILDFQQDCESIISPWDIVTVDGSNSEFSFNGLALENLILIPYIQGKIVCYPINEDQYGMSFLFSGCEMVKFKYSGKLYIGHISLLGKDNPSDCRTLWDKFVSDSDNKISDIVSFKPMTDDLQTKQALLVDEYRKLSADICGLITPENECYSVLIDISTKEAIDIIYRSDARYIK